MTRQSALPLYVQITELLIRDITAGRLADGERLPPERDLAERLGTSVGTLRKSLSALEEKGLVDRVQGSGNYIRKKADVDSIYAFFRLEKVTGGGLPTADIVSVDRCPKPENLPEIGASRSAFRIRRIRHLDGLPVALEEIWLDGAKADDLKPDDLSDSLYLFYRERLGFWITRAEDHVGVETLPDWAPAELGLDAGASAGFVSRVSWAQSETAVEASMTWFNTNKARYVARLR